MKLRPALLTILYIAPLAVAQWSYDTGPINGTTFAWTISSGYVVSDSFYASGSTNGFTFGAWEFLGDSLTSVDWSIATGVNGAATIGPGMVGPERIVVPLIGAPSVLGDANSCGSTFLRRAGGLTPILWSPIDVIPIDNVQMYPQEGSGRRSWSWRTVAC